MPEKTQQAPRKVCIVDDDPSIREIYKKELEGNDFEVVTAEDGEKGLAVIQTEKPDIVLADILMPVMNGIEMITKLRMNGEFAKIPIVVMSNVDDQETMEKAGALDARFYLVKSLYDPHKVVGIVREVLRYA